MLLNKLFSKIYSVEWDYNNNQKNYYIIIKFFNKKKPIIIQHKSKNKIKRIFTRLVTDLNNYHNVYIDKNGNLRLKK